MTKNLFDNITDRTDRALVGIGAVEQKLKAVVPELRRLQPVLDKNASKLEAVYLTLEEVSKLVRDIKREIEAGGGNLAEDMDILNDLADDLTTQREDIARLTTITRHVNFFLEDPNTLKNIFYGVIKVRPEMREIIKGWLTGEVSE